MFCPKCATQNLGDAKFCRSCGADISLVPQAMSGQLAARLSAADDARASRHARRGRHEEPPTIERAVRHLFMGLAFLFIAFAIKTWMPGGHVWWFWMFLPAAGLLGDALSTHLRLAAEEKRHAAPQAYAPAQTSVPPPRRAGSLSPGDTGEMVPPPSVTEGTTRHLGVPAEHGRRDA